MAKYKEHHRKRIRLPKVKTHKALFANKVDIRALDIIDKIVADHADEDLAKWRVINHIICGALGIKDTTQINIKKYKYKE